MDPLSDILALLRPLEVGWRLIEGQGGWTLHMPPRPDIVVFGHTLEGACEVRRRGEFVGEATAGDFLLMASPAAWTMSTGEGPEVTLKALIADPSLLQRDDAGAPTRLVGGYFAFDPLGAELISGLLPPVVHVQAEAAARGRLGALTSMLGDETGRAHPGRAHVMERLLELMLVETLRSAGHGWSEAHPGLLRGLSDPRIARALGGLHADPARGWTVTELASEAGMSRSNFALRFQALVGVPPLEYLSRWRIARARQALAAGRLPMSAIAEFAGYGSVSAFSTAFRRKVGASPSKYIGGLVKA